MSVIGAVIVPHPPIILHEVGGGEERQVQKTIDSYRKAAQWVAALKPDTLVVTSPHSILYSDYLHISPGAGASGSFSKFRAPQVSMSVRYDEAFVEALVRHAEGDGIPAGTLGEREKELDHGTMIPLYYIREAFGGELPCQVLRCSISGLSAQDHYRFGMCVADTAKALDRNIVIVASGDLSHKLKEDGPYGYAPEGPLFDEQVTSAMERGDFLTFLRLTEDFCEAAAECGLRSFLIMAGALDGRSVHTELLSYQGTFGVGYAVCLVEPGEADESRRFGQIFDEEERRRVTWLREREDVYVRLARASLETYVRTGRRLELREALKQQPEAADEEELLQRRAGAFVSLKLDGKLRGCIGTIGPTTPCVAQEILRNAVSAGAEDPRFGPVEAGELERLVYSVDVLSEPETVTSAEELDVGRYGVIVSRDSRRGLLLPNLEGVDTVEAQLEIALQKAGIRPGERYEIQRFEVVRHR